MLQPISESPSSVPAVSTKPKTKDLGLVIDKEDSRKSTPLATYTFEESSAAALEYFHGDTLAANTWVTKYALKDGDGKYLELTPRDMHWRMAREFARIEAKYPNPMSKEEIFDLFKDWTVVPQGSPMSGIGNPFRVQAHSNCYVIPAPKDSYGGLLLTDQQQVQIMKRRGGVGFDISTIRPSGLPVHNAAQTTDGLGLFMERFSRTCREVAQNARRGALMLTCSVHHPDILTFIRIKNEQTSCRKCGHEERTKVTGANISVRLSDEFLQAVEDGTTYQLRWPCDPKMDPVVTIQMDAREVWDEIIQNARDSAEPGLLFWDNILRESPADCYADIGYRTTSTNPCAELPISNSDSCRLLLVNLSKFVTASYTDQSEFDWMRFQKTAMKAQRLMDDLVDLELEQIDKILAKVGRDPEAESVKQVEFELWSRIREACVNGRRTGLGITALGDTLAMLGHKYGDDDSIEVAEKIYRALAVSSYESSVDMAAERGPFPVYNFIKEQNHPFIERILEAGGSDLRAKYEKYGRRNIANLTTAPAGSVSLLTQTSSGIEPVFKAQYVRKKKINSSDTHARVDEVDSQGDKWTHFMVKEHGLQRWQEVTGKTDADFAESPYFGAEAEDLDWKRRVQLQARVGRYIDHSISSTLNLPEDVTVEEVKNIYVEAWKSGCKGITIYRKNCREGVLIEQKKEFHQHAAPKRPDRLPCEVHRSRIRIGESFQDWIFFVGLLENKPFEIFGGATENIEMPKKIETGWIVKRSFKSGGKYDFTYGDPEDPTRIKDVVAQFGNPDRGWATRMVSLSLRHGTPIQFIVEQLGRDQESDVFDFAKSCARVLKKYVPDGTTSGTQKVCDDCGAEGTLRYSEGCLMCLSCGMSKCG